MYTYSQTRTTIQPRRRPAAYRDRTRILKVTLSSEQYRLLAAEIAEVIRNRGDTHEILFGNRIYNIDAKVQETDRKAHTGVEWLGMRETFIKTDFALTELKIEGVYGFTGVRLPSDIQNDSLKQLVKEQLERT